MRLLAVVGQTTRDFVDGGRARIGGPPFYAARALRLLEVPGLVATKCAEEDRPLLGALVSLGLRVEWRPAAETAVFRHEYRGSHRETTVEALGEPWAPGEARGWLRRALAPADWVHAGAVSRNDFPAETLAELGRDRVLSLDGQGLVRPARTGPLELDSDFDPAVLQAVDVLNLSEAEADVLGLTLDDRSLGSLGVAEVVVTLGPRGSVVYSDGLAEYVPARPLANVDPTGAGDTFMAGYLASRRAGHAPASAARRATGLVHGALANRLTA